MCLHRRCLITGTGTSHRTRIRLAHRQNLGRWSNILKGMNFYKFSKVVFMDTDLIKEFFMMYDGHVIYVLNTK